MLTIELNAHYIWFIEYWGNIFSTHPGHVDHYLRMVQHYSICLDPDKMPNDVFCYNCGLWGSSCVQIWPAEPCHTNTREPDHSKRGTSSYIYKNPNYKNSCVIFHTNLVLESSNRVWMIFTQEFLWLFKESKRKKRITLLNLVEFVPGLVGWQPRYANH
jgi:hypothetical protein